MGKIKACRKELHIVKVSKSYNIQTMIDICISDNVSYSLRSEIKDESTFLWLEYLLDLFILPKGWYNV